MTPCEKVLGLLNDHADGELSPEDSRAVKEHLSSCARCASALEDLHRLLARAASLPRSLEPPRDLWAGIEARLANRATPDRLPALPAPTGWPRPLKPWAEPVLLWAAAVLLVVSAGAASLLLSRHAPPRTEPARGALSGIETVGWRQMDRDYGRARVDLLRVVAERRDLLKPETRAVVDENLALIEKALTNIRGALEKDPANRTLMDLLGNTYRQEQDMLRRAAALPSDT
jgi:hypothetical protein